jgi:hypothetical protein
VERLGRLRSGSPSETRAVPLEEILSLRSLDSADLNSVVIIPATEWARSRLLDWGFAESLPNTDFELWSGPQYRQIGDRTFTARLDCTTGDFIQVETIDRRYRLLEWSSVLPLQNLLEAGLPREFSDDTVEYVSVAFDNGEAVEGTTLREIRNIVAHAPVQAIALRIIAGERVFGWSSDWGFHRVEPTIKDIVLNQCAVMTRDSVRDAVSAVELSAAPAVGNYAVRALDELNMI